MRYVIITAVLCSVLILSGSYKASAQIQDPILTLPDGQVILNISATERQDVAQDLLVATLSYSATGSDSRAIQSEINSTMAKALEAIKKVDTVKVETGSYQVYETTVPRTLEKIWQGSQLLTLKSKNADDLLALTGALQDMKLTMNGLNYTLDPKVAVKVQDDLMEAALKQLQTRADRAAKALKKSTAELREVQTQGMDVPYAPMMQNFSRMEVAQDQVAPPVAAAGETTITLTVSARAILKP